MGFSKEFAVGKIGKLALSEANGALELSFVASEEVGGIASFTGSLGVKVSASDLANALFELIESKSPAGLVVIEKEVQSAAIALLNKS